MAPPTQARSIEAILRQLDHDIQSWSAEDKAEAAQNAPGLVRKGRCEVQT
jgi:hypothetical protein